MDAKDLMIGDWVINTEFDKNEISQIEIVEPNRVWLKDGKLYIPIYYIKPIPLTPEILEKNGLNFNEYGYGYLPEDKNYTLEICCDGNGIYWTIHDTEYDIMEFKFVHQLQHALKLCGIEKEIIV